MKYGFATYKTQICIIPNETQNDAKGILEDYYWEGHDGPAYIVEIDEFRQTQFFALNLSAQACTCLDGYNHASTIFKQALDKAPWQWCGWPKADKAFIVASIAEVNALLAALPESI